MKSDSDSSTLMTDAPATPTEDVDREMDVIQPPGEHRISTDVCVVAMEPSAAKSRNDR